MIFHVKDVYNEDELLHYGTPRHSGRYPWGSGKNPQRNRNFLNRVKELENQGMSQKEIADIFGMSTGKLRQYQRIYNEQLEMDQRLKAEKLKNKQGSNVAIAKELGVTEGTIRHWLKSDPTDKKSIVNIAETLKKTLEEKPYLDVGEGVHRQLGISQEQLDTALTLLKDQGYNVYDYKMPQASNPSQ